MAEFDFKEFLKTSPSLPGVYLMQDAGDEVLYVGKAGDLRKRLSSYARVDPGLHSKTAVMLSRLSRISIIVTGSEKEALLLEASLIKQHRPKYNVILRDDKSYPFIKVTVQEEWPRLLMTRRRIKDGARYFGPFSSSSAMWETIRYLHALFPLRRCKDAVLKAKARPCLNQQMGRCLAPCTGRIDREKYLQMVREIIMVLEGKNQQLIRELSLEMEGAAVALRFEEAAAIRDRIRSLASTLERQQVVAGHLHDQDVFGFVRKDASVAVSLLYVRKGVISGQQSFFLAEPVGRDAEILSEVLCQFYGVDEQYLPHEILLPFPVADGQLLSDWLSERCGRQVAVLVPQRGDKVRLLEMSSANAEQVFADRGKKNESWQALSRALRKTLHLAESPERIECLDISNLGGRQAVGSLVCFLAGEKAGKFYRHYKIRTVDGPDDYAMMGEVLSRRFAKAVAENDFPDLFLLDGGKGQLGMAVNVLKELGIGDRVELASIAKEKANEGEKLFRPGRKNPIVPARHSPALLYLMRIRDEAHRYGITLHRRLRQKKTLASKLDEIPGVGKVRKEALLKGLGSLKRIESAGFEELSQVPGIGPELALQIWRALHEFPAAGEGERGDD